MSEFNGWVSMAVRFYLAMFILYGTLLGGCVAACYHFTKHGVYVEVK